MLEDYLRNKTDFNYKFIIGSNGSGKTHTLNQIYKDYPSKTLLITEDGELKIESTKRKVHVDLEKRVYIIPSDERNYGNRNRSDVDIVVDIEGKNLELLNFCNEKIAHFNRMKSLSRGQYKVKNILNIIYTTFLNPINILLIDEPENFLDDYFLKVVSDMILYLSKSKIKVVIATHSSRLCELCTIGIDDVLLLNLELIDENIVYRKNCVTINEMKLKFSQISEGIENIRKLKQYDIDGGVDAKLKLHTNNYIFDMYLNHFLNSEEFYKALFYNDIYLVEGSTEKSIIKKAKHDIKNGVYFFSTEGKVFIPIFAWLFSRIGKSIIIIIDSDRGGNSLKTQVAITEYLEENYKENLRVFEPDFENHFCIDVKEFKRKYSVNNNLASKPIVAQEHFNDQNNRSNFFEFIN